MPSLCRGRVTLLACDYTADNIPQLLLPIHEQVVQLGQATRRLHQSALMLLDPSVQPYYLQQGSNVDHLQHYYLHTNLHQLTITCCPVKATS